MFVIIFLLHMTTEVTPTDLRVWFGWAPTSRRIVPIGTVRGIEVVTYRPIADYGFWGIRSGRDGERALIARGNRGVRLELTDGTRLLIGSQRPEALATALDCAEARGLRRASRGRSPRLGFPGQRSIPEAGGDQALR